MVSFDVTLSLLIPSVPLPPSMIIQLQPKEESSSPVGNNETGRVP